MNKDNTITQSLINDDVIGKIRNISPSSCGLFNLHTANEAMMLALQQPDPVYLYPVLILQNEFIICFADPGAGKTVLCFNAAKQIAESGHTTLYFDLELSKKQFQRRYTDDQAKPMEFAPNLYRLDFARLTETPKGISYEDFFFESLLEAVGRTNAKVIFLDNLTKLAAGDTDTAKAAIPILERLNRIKLEEGLTIIALEHNKKVDPSRGIHLNDLQGSKMKSNLVDSIFSIGKSARDTNIRYVKQLKARDGEIIYDSENVLVCELSRHNGFLSFQERGFGPELEHLKPITDKEEKIATAIALKSAGLSNVEIASQFGVTEACIRKWLRRNG